MNALKRNLNFESFWEDAKNTENDANTSRTFFFILKIFIKKQGVKIWIMTIMMIKQIDFKKKVNKLFINNEFLN